MTTCWICGEKANTREHRVKASDLRKVFGPVSQSAPLFNRHDGVRINTLQSVKSDHAKFKAKICHKCNSTRTQPHDRAWDQLTGYLLHRQDEISSLIELDLSDVFTGDFQKGILDCHLYLLKVFGCRILDDGIPIDLKTFSDCIINEQSHPDVYFSVDKRLDLSKEGYAALSNVQAIVSKDKKIAYYAAWYYILGKVAIKVLYYVGRPPKHVHGHMIHPDSISRTLKL